VSDVSARILAMTFVSVSGCRRRGILGLRFNVPHETTQAIFETAFAAMQSLGIVKNCSHACARHRVQLLYGAEQF